jgi:hypothetical protein
MTTFLFMLTPDSESALVERVSIALEAQFPAHEFAAGGADYPEFENSILAVHGTAGSGETPGVVHPPEPKEVQRVKEAFASILNESKNWKTS